MLEITEFHHPFRYENTPITLLELTVVAVSITTPSTTETHKGLPFVLWMLRDETEELDLCDELAGRFSTGIEAAKSIADSMKQDEYIDAHIQNVAVLAHQMADHMGLTNELRHDLVLAAYLHGCGKLIIPNEILHKSERLFSFEWQLIRAHPTFGYLMINPIPGLEHIAYAVLSHHENFDGSGYPIGIKGYDIPFAARIIRVIDSYDAMTGNRLYGIQRMPDEALYELKRLSGVWYDPDIVDAFVELIQRGFKYEYIDIA